MSAPNIERFNALAGAIFAKLYEEFPVPVELSAHDFADQMIASDAPRFLDLRFFTSTVIWLGDHGYLSRGNAVSNGTVLNCSLTARALELLNALPSALENKGTSLGDELISATKEGLTGKVKELASDFLSKAVVFGTKAATEWATS
jgi:hypothetical protein